MLIKDLRLIIVIYCSDEAIIELNNINKHESIANICNYLKSYYTLLMTKDTKSIGVYEFNTKIISLKKYNSLIDASPNTNFEIESNSKLIMTCSYLKIIKSKKLYISCSLFLTYLNIINSGCDMLKNITHLTLENETYYDTNKFLFPQKLKFLDLSGFNYAEQINFPKTLTHLKLCTNFYKLQDISHISLTHLTFGTQFNRKIDRLSNTIKYLEFGFNFDQNIDTLKTSITHLIFGYMFNKNIDNLPNSITHLTFGDMFTQTINKLPTSIKQMTFGRKFNHFIDLSQYAVTHLTLGEKFNQPIDTSLKTLTHLTFDVNYTQLERNLQDSITHLNIVNKYTNRTEVTLRIKTKLPQKLKKLTITPNIFAHNKDLIEEIQDKTEIMINAHHAEITGKIQFSMSI